MFLSVFEGNVRGAEADPEGCVSLEEIPDTASQDSTNQDIRIEYDHLNGLRASLAGAVA